MELDAICELKNVIVYTDGGCIGNPGPGGYGTVLLYGEKRRELSGGFRRTTNNRMEIMAAISGLEVLRYRCSVIVYTDSQYLANSIMLGWALKWRAKGWMRKDKPVPNADLWIRLLDLCGLHQVQFEWVKGHAGNTENERCDRLSVNASKGKDLPIDVGYENPFLSSPKVESSRPVDGLFLEIRCEEEESSSEIDFDSSPAISTPTQILSAASIKLLEAEDKKQKWQSTNKVTAEGQPCRKCSTPVIRQDCSANRRPGQRYYYEFYLLCPNCREIHNVTAAKRSILI